MKLLFSILLISLFSILNASMYSAELNECIESYYIDGDLYYILSSSGAEMSTRYTEYVLNILPGYIYDPATGHCTPESFISLGITSYDYAYLSALTAVAFFTMLFYALTNLFTR